MRLLSATVRNYRVHRETTVEFDQGRTLIGGSNEAGKTTFVEAIHRALFLKATVTGEAKASMESMLWAGHPEVEVRFEAQGHEYQLVKRFAGQNGTTRLTLVGGSTWQGEEAQSRLAALLGVDDPGSGRGILDRVAQQWGHLWVWQGAAGDDPSVQMTAQQTDLLQQLQEAGGAVAMQSPLDSRVATRFSQLRNGIFTKAGAPKQGSEVGIATAEVEGLEKEVIAAHKRVDDLRDAARDYAEAEAAIESATGDRDAVTVQLQEAEQRLDGLRGLRTNEEKQLGKVASAEERLDALQAADTKIKEFEGLMETLEQSLAPREADLKGEEETCADYRRRKEGAERRYDDLLADTRKARLARELAEAYVDRMQKEARIDELRPRMAQVTKLQEKLEGVRGDLARLAPISAKELKDLQDLETERDLASAALSAMATELEVVAATQAVTIGGEDVGAGERRTLTDPTEIEVGSALIKVFPGGGHSLATARERMHSSEKEMQETLDRYGLTTLEQAVDIVAHRNDLEGRESFLVAGLEQWDPERLAKELEAAEQGYAAAAAEVERRLSQADHPEAFSTLPLPLPSTPDEAQKRLRSAEQELKAAEASEKTAKEARDTLGRESADAEEGLEQLRLAMADDKNSLLEARAQLNLLVANHGTEGMRERALEEAQAAHQEAQDELATIRSVIAALQPDALEFDLTRFKRALEEIEDRRQAAVTTKAVSGERLRSEGTRDPIADLSLVEARLAAVRERLADVEQKAAAIALVDGLFQQEQQILADRFSQPLAEKITGYLQCLFGPDAKATVSFQNQCFQKIALARRGGQGSLDFSDLSGGTREQVAAAVRLAMAELLAGDHGGSLPVVFDDSFAYSDPERVQTLQRMLDLGSRQGLQIIVVTCNPSDYVGLGARQVVMRAERPAGG